MNIAFLVSGNGSNMQAVIDACKNNTIKAKPSLVISNKSQAYALKRAEIENIPAFVIKDNQVILEKLQEYQIDLIILAGYLKKISNDILHYYKNKIINIHPSLLPKYGGKGMYGLHVHKAVLAAGENITGATVHWVSEEYDQGPILAQVKVPILKEDTPQSLGKRVLEQEHQLLITTVQQLV